MVSDAAFLVGDGYYPGLFGHLTDLIQRQSHSGAKIIAQPAAFCGSWFAGITAGPAGCSPPLAALVALATTGEVRSLVLRNSAIEPQGQTGAPTETEAFQLPWSEGQAV